MLLQGNNYVIAKWSGGLLNIHGKKPDLSSPLGGQEGGLGGSIIALLTTANPQDGRKLPLHPRWYP